MRLNDWSKGTGQGPPARVKCDSRGQIAWFDGAACRGGAGHRLVTNCWPWTNQALAWSEGTMFW